MNRADLSGVLVKIDRAKTHLSDFEAQAGPIIRACQEAVIREHDEQRSAYVFRFGQVPAVPSGLSAIIGDAVHNLRVSLDHLAWQLVIATGGKPNKKTGFPICKTAPAPGQQGSCIFPQIHPGVPVPLRELLDEVQPYKRAKPAFHQLEVLNKLDISDKHHQLLFAIVGINDLAWWGEAEPTQVNLGPYGDGSEICRFACSEHEVNPIFRFTLHLVEPAAGPWKSALGAAKLVRQSLDYVESEVLPRFQSYIA